LGAWLVLHSFFQIRFSLRETRIPFRPWAGYFRDPLSWCRMAAEGDASDLISGIAGVHRRLAALAGTTTYETLGDNRGPATISLLTRPDCVRSLGQVRLFTG
jgi:hypothetical protein